MAFGVKKVKRGGRTITTFRGRNMRALLGGSSSGGGGTQDESGFDLEAFINAWRAQQEADAAASAGYSRTQADYESQARLEAQLSAEAEERQWQRQLQQAEAQRAYEAEQARLRAEEERKRQIEQLLAQRQSDFIAQKGIDPVRAVLFGLGLGQEAGQFNAAATRLGTVLPPLEGVAGAQGFEGQTEQALNRLLGRTNIDIGTPEGVSNLGSAEQSARQFQFGGGNEQTLLQSAFGVGGLGGGLRAEDYRRRIEEVTPKGLLI